MSYYVSTDFQEIEDVENKLGKFSGNAKRIVGQSINQAMKDTQKDITKDVGEELTLKSKSIKQRFKIQKTTKDNPEGQLIAKERNAPNVVSFRGVRQSKKLGVRGVVRKDRGAEEIKRHGFITKTRYRHGGVKLALYRMVKSSGKRVGRKPLLPVQGPSPLGMLENKPGFLDKHKNSMADNITSRVDTNVAKLLERKTRMAAKTVGGSS